MTDIPARVRAFWDSIKATGRPGVSADELAAFQATHNVVLPPSVAAFYRTVNGTIMDNEVFQAWPLAELGPVPSTVATYRGTPDYGAIVQTLPDANDYFAFGDCMILSQVMAVRLRPLHVGTPVVWIQGHYFVRVAGNFDEFWERYLVDPVSVLWATPDVAKGA
jgi:hypothetical protein